MNKPVLTELQKNYIHHFCIDTGSHLEDLQGALPIGTDDERESKESLMMVEDM